MNKNEDQFKESNALDTALSAHSDQLKQATEANARFIEALNKRYGSDKE